MDAIDDGLHIVHFVWLIGWFLFFLHIVAFFSFSFLQL